MRSRRTVLAACAAASTAVAGCTSWIDETQTGDGNPSETTGSPSDTDTCSAGNPPQPTDSVADVRSYPDRPDELTSATLKPFLESYEWAYLYNDMVASNPEKYGRTNEITVRIQSVVVNAGDEGFTATVSGQVQTDIIRAETATDTPETATDTPLPIGHRPVQTSYEITGRELKRNGVVLECW